MAGSGDIDIDSIIERLLSVLSQRPGKMVNLENREIKALCVKSREIFISQPVLLELEAPIKICGTFSRMFWPENGSLKIGFGSASSLALISSAIELYCAALVLYNLCASELQNVVSQSATRKAER